MKNAFLDMTREKSVGFFGLGRSNAALIRLMGEECEITLRSDGRILPEDIPKGAKIRRIYEGREAASEIDEDILVFSPSVRRDRQELLSALGRGCVFTSDFEIFLRYNEKPVYLITGSDGKTTTTTLISQILGYPAIGNIGEAMTPHLEDNAEGFAVEASSFMLEYAHPKSRRAAITSLTENHLNWHYTADAYREAKLRAILGAEEAVITADSPMLTEGVLPKKVFAVCGASAETESVARRLSAELCYTTDGKYITKNGRRIIAIGDLCRQEKYNIKNYMTSLAMTAGIADEDRAAEIIRRFGGIPHRGEHLGKIAGISFINSSIDTTPERTIATLEGLPEGLIILLGGRDKGLSRARLFELIKRRGDRVIAFGEAEERIAAELGDGCIRARGGLASATKKAAEISRGGDTVLLSPAATSYDEFRSFEERGDMFKELVLQLF